MTNVHIHVKKIIPYIYIYKYTEKAEGTHI